MNRFPARDWAAVIRFKIQRWIKSLRSRFVERVRIALGFYTDEARDLLIDGTRRDQDALVTAIQRQSDEISALRSRLKFYENRIPRMRELRRAFEHSHRESQASTARAAAATTEDLSHGILSIDHPPSPPS